MSKESRFIGYLVLGFGVIAIVAVLLLVFGGEKVETAQMPQEATSDQSLKVKPEDLKKQMTNPVRVVKPAVQDTLYFKRDPDLDVGDMEGDWQGQIGSYTAILQIRKNIYQIILASPDPNAKRLYSSGTFSIAEDMAVLSPRNDWPTPVTKAGSNIQYQKITVSPFPMLIKFENGSMLWQNPPQSEKRVIAPRTSPIFMSEPVRYVAWKKL
ncbi:MAG: hypothetical protein DI551_04760 [Micavibrio aeruginosavorus]|uniref:Uncharacterized protein n=1 Tax=Micavibrio aeruginosavorus TaxID=349221 RepID=A0A2W5PVX7_9BACT|nr:MAG: hypothetical protein DI551_04760 [Micavibrio aeruginosavorus]